MNAVDALKLYSGQRRAWDTKPPPWAPRRPASWYLRRARDTAEVVAAAERAAPADITAPER